MTKVLIVEDELKMAEFIRKGLLEAGYEAESCETAAEAEKRISSKTYDLIILDVMLPDRTGFETARGVRNGGVKTPILMLTALSGTQDKVQGLDAGADDYLTKPFAFEELLARIRALQRRQPETQPILRFADLELDLLKRKVLREGQEITLTQKEFGLLEFLMRHAGQPVSRATISQEVWGVKLDPESNVIDVYVNMLRKKLEAGGRKRVIHTVVGFGYAVQDEA